MDIGAWRLLHIIEDPLSKWLEPKANFDDTWHRHKNPLYWFDSNYLSAVFALLGLGVCDLWERPKERNSLLFPVFGIAGTWAGFGIQLLLRTAGWEGRFASALTYLQGAPSYLNRARLMYHYPSADKLELLKNKQTRFGTEATWRSKPNLKNEKGQ